MSEQYNLKAVGFEKRYRNLLIAFVTAFFVGIYLWFYSTLPPYGTPGNELSNHLWGVIVSTAHKWRALTLSFWDREIGAGTALYSSGFYPIFNPTNITAFFCDDANFFKIKIIETYVFGVFFAVLVLLEIFRLRWTYAVFGGLLYMGLGFGRQATLTDSSCFLWGCALFPALIYAFGKFAEKKWMLAAAFAGFVVSMQFFTEGASQFLQTVLWGMLFWTVHSFWPHVRKITLSQMTSRWIIGCVVFGFFAVGLCAVQFVPTFYFSFIDSIRMSSGQYQINNFPLIYPNPVEPKGSVMKFLTGILISPGGVSWRVIMALFLLAMAMVLTNIKYFQKLFRKERLFGIICTTTIIYFLIPPVAGWLASGSALLTQILKPLSYITFAYAVHMIDFAAMLVLVFVLNHSEKAVRSSKKNIVWIIAVFMAVLYVLLPVMMSFSFVKDAVIAVCPVLEAFVPASFKSACVIFIVGIFLIFYYVFQPRQKWMSYAARVTLIFVGFMVMMLSFQWNNKGQQTHLADYYLDTPEMKYYQNARGKFYLPYDDFNVSGHNYNLLYDVAGTSGFLQLPSKRFNQFMASYHNDRMKTKEFWWMPKYKVSTPASAIATRFPVDFTMIQLGTDLPWSGFQKEINGDNFDVWVREAPAPRVLFATTLLVENFDSVIKAFDVPFAGVMRVTSEDAAIFNVDEKVFPNSSKDKPQYSDFVQVRGDELTFKTNSATEIFVMVPEIFQSGWKVFVDDGKVKIFPADHLFVGFEVPAGEHVVVMKFLPPYFQIGLLISLVSLLLFVLLILRVQKVKF
ncbi:MAG: YfhO family protein [Candidatus Omnitrophica bacterium]|nr:YfhO family protein [Candidatus Omnitrophota bacterium]